MLPINFTAKTRIIGVDQEGVVPLAIQDIEIEGQNAMVSYWRPSPDELAVLNDGGFVELVILGRGHPPVMLSVNEGV